MTSLKQGSAESQERLSPRKCVMFLFNLVIEDWHSSLLRFTLRFLPLRRNHSRRIISFSFSSPKNCNLNSISPRNKVVRKLCRPPPTIFHQKASSRRSAGRQRPYPSHCSAFHQKAVDNRSRATARTSADLQRRRSSRKSSALLTPAKGKRCTVETKFRRLDEEEELTPIIHVQSENSGFTTSVTLTEVNYDVWSQIMEMQIAGREKLEYIMGKTQFPQETDASYAKWYAENQKVKGWLLTTMSLDIMKRYIRLHESQLFSLNQRPFSTKQTGHPLSTYYGDLVEIFQELDHRDRTIMKDPDDVISYRKSFERLRVHIFLNGLDAEFEQVRGEILRKDPILDLEEAYAYVRRDSVRRTTLNSEVDRVKTSAMVARRAKPKTARPTSPNSYQNQTSGSQNRSYEVGTTKLERICTHYGEIGHTKERYYELIGYPECRNSEWIIDSGATDHMAFDNYHVKSMKPSEQHIVSTANGHSNLEDNWLGHSSFGYLKKLFPTLFAKLSISEFKCDVCELAKSHRVPFQISMNRSSAPFMIIHFDVWGPVKIVSLNDKRWFVSFIDDHTQRKNHHLLEVVHASLFEAHMSASYWGEAIATAAYLINRIPSSVLQFKTHLSVLHKTISSPAVPNLPPKKGYHCYHPPSQKLYVTLDVGENTIELKTLYHQLDILDTTSGQYSDYGCGHQNDTNQHDSQDGERQDQMEVMLSESQLPSSPLHNVPIDQLPSESESMSKPQNSTWEVVDLPVGKTPVGCRWYLPLNIKPMAPLKVIGNDPEEKKSLQSCLAKEFEMKDLGYLKYFLGIEVSRSKEGIFLSQRKYALDLLKKIGMTACSPVSTPMEENLKLGIHSDQVLANKERYQRLVGRLMYLAHTRPDLAYVLSVTSPLKLYCDNKAARDIAHNPVQHDRTKHVEVDRHFIKEKLEARIIEVPHVRFEDQLTDVLTKAVSYRAFNKCLDKLGISDIYAPT
ncbi:uncharacterized protein [Aristolochia californica]|uniref:uncharacterized protein n=1 Tax=Aristolochia californica TaxID=171875 RepID=UPI0035D5EE71